MFYIMALGVGVLIQVRVFIQGNLLFCKASRGCCIWPCGWELISGRAPVRTRAFI